MKENMSELDVAKRFSFVGVENADKMVKDLWNTVNNHKKVSINVLRDNDVEVVDVDGADIIVITVPRADYSLRPIYINDNPNDSAPDFSSHFRFLLFTLYSTFAC